MNKFEDIAAKYPDKDPLKDVFTTIAKKHEATDGVGDGPKMLSFTMDEVTSIRNSLYQAVQNGYAEDGQTVATLEQARKDAVNVFGVKDSYYNQVTGVGTGIDPGSYNTASIPVSMGPQEATAIYSSGGIAQVIIDKKAKGIFLNGYQFIGKDWKPEWLEELKDYSETLNFEKAATQVAVEALIYGGAIIVPALQDDDGMTYQMTQKELIDSKKLAKGSLRYFWVADRWNTVLIPDYNISAQSYLTPASVMVPITGLEVSTDRLAIVRLKQLPYWGTLRQMGWGISDIEAYIRSLLQYETMMASIGIMSQQLSLLYRMIPLDGIIMQNGPEYAKDFAEKSSVVMRQMSSMNPVSMNSIGEIKTIERHFTDFDKLVMLARQDIGAKAGISDTVIFNSQATGFSDNKEDTTLKQAETIKLLGNDLAMQLDPIVKMMVYSCFGPDSPQAKAANSIRISFESPTVMTNEEKTQSLVTLGGWLTQATVAGIQIGDAVTMARQFMPELEIPKEIETRLAAFDDSEQEETDEEKDDNGETKVESGAKVKDGWMGWLFKRGKKDV